MNLYVFCEKTLGNVYGIGTYIRELVSTLKNSAINVYIINLASEKPQIKIEEINGTTYWHFPPPIQWSKELEEHWDLYHRNIVYLLQLHIKDKNNLIFHLNYNQKVGLAKELKKAFNCKIVLTIHFFDYYSKLSVNSIYSREIHNMKQTYIDDKGLAQLRESIQKEKQLFQTADHIICLSNKTRQILQDEYRINRDKISVIYNGLADTTILTNKSELRQKFRISSDAPVILFAGRLDGLKGLAYALRAFKIVLNTHPDCRFIIAGRGDFDLHMLECEDIWMNVIWTGFINKEKLYELYTIANIGIMPSFHEQCSYVVIEMMMHGLPIIGTSTGMSEMVENEVTGLHIPVIENSHAPEIDSSIFAEKIIYLLQNATKVKEMGENGRKKYLHNYSAEVFRNNMLKLYESCWCSNENRIKTLLVTGQNNHKWEVSHIALKLILENSGLFIVDIATSPKEGEYMFNFKPDFAGYQLVVLDYCGDRWPKETEQSFLDFVEKGGGIIIYHSANNAFRDWKEYNKIIGFGGWENRDETDGPYIYLKDNKVFYDKESQGRGGSHGLKHEFVLQCGNLDHPITKGLPSMWRHAQDELYDRMRGPGIIKDVLFWAHSTSNTKGSGRDELAMFTVDYGKARIFHTTLGHVGDDLDNNIAMQCAGFQVILLRGAEWAATGKVTQEIPDDFPSATTISLRHDYKYSQNL